MKTDKRLHKIFEDLKRVRWHDFEEVGYNAPYFQYYYAEDRLYIICDIMLGNYWFVEAGSPAEAMQICEKRMEEARKAGSWVDEEEY